MSEEQKSDKKNDSPSGAGKSLAVMQQRLLSKGGAEEAGGGNVSAAAQAAAAASASNSAAQAVQNRPKSKGKDFAAMAMNARATSAPVAAPPVPQPPAPPVQQPLAPNRSKGKDLARMMPPQAPVAPVHPQDPARAAKMQAAARAAAGLPPLAQPTATSVTVAPPPIQASVPAQRPPAAPVAAPQAPYRPSPQSMQVPKAVPIPPKVPTPMAVDPRHQAMPRAKPETTKAAVGRSTSVGSQGRRNSGSKQQILQPPMVAAPVAPPPAAPKPKPTRTAQPAAIESRVSFSAGRPSGPHVSPLVGQRLRDLVASLDKNYVLDAEAEEQVLQLADDFLDKVTRQSLKLAQHRQSKTLDVQDVQLALSKQWGIVVPGLGPPTLNRPTKPANRASASATKRRASSSESSKGGAAKKAKMSASTASKTS